MNSSLKLIEANIPKKQKRCVGTIFPREKLLIKGYPVHYLCYADYVKPNFDSWVDSQR